MSHTIKKPYTKSKRFDPTCRCNGKCSYCRDNRLHSTYREKSRVNAWLKDFLEDDDD